MFVLELSFSEDPRRVAARPGHRERLLTLHTEGHLVMAGPLADDAGAMLVFDTDRPGLDRIIGDDPYYSTPGVRIASVREWHPIVGT